MSRKPMEWKLGADSLLLGERTQIVGALDLTPDAPEGAGRFADPDRAYVQALQMADEGADLIELEGQALYAGAATVAEAEELRRVVPLLKRLRGKIAVPLGVRTDKAVVAEKAIEYGAVVIHDATGLTVDPLLAKVVRDHDAGLVLSQMRGLPETWAKLPPMRDPAGTVTLELQSALHRATRAGVEKQRIVLDPGLGFGKRKEQNTEILARLERVLALDMPLQVAPGRVQFTGPAHEPLTAAAAAVIAALKGAHLVRTYDVAALRTALSVADAVAGVQG
jgi:dihydropteroate synthase